MSAVNAVVAGNHSSSEENGFTQLTSFLHNCTRITSFAQKLRDTEDEFEELPRALTASRKKQNKQEKSPGATVQGFKPITERQVSRQKRRFRRKKS
jgi:hypothetical protein